MKTTQLLLILTFTTLLTPLQANPLNQLGSVLASTTAQLSQLANLGLNNQSFDSMVSLLNNLFANMQVLSEPYFNSMITQMVLQNQALLDQIIALENQTASTSTLLFRYLDSASTVLSSQLGNIGNILTQYQNTVNPSVTALQTLVSGISSASVPLPSLANSITQVNGQVQNAVNSLLVSQPADEIALMTILDTFPFITKFLLSSLTLASSDLPFCQTFSYTFTNTFVNVPVVYANLVTVTDPSTVTYSEMDIIVLSNTATSANFMVCDRSFSTFTLIDSYVEVSVFSVDV